MPTTGRLIIGPWRERLPAYRDDECRILQQWAEHFERIAAGEATLTRKDAGILARNHRSRLAARVERLDLGTARAGRRERLEREAAAHERHMADRRRREKAGTPLQELGLSAPLPLWFADIATVEELAQKSGSELLALHNIGPKRVAEIKQALGKLGLNLATEGESMTAKVFELHTEGQNRDNTSWHQIDTIERCPSRRPESLLNLWFAETEPAPGTYRIETSEGGWFEAAYAKRAVV